MAKQDPDTVKVQHANGCGSCGRTDAHTHTQAEHKAQLDKAGKS